ncbi:uncharacterized protein LOC124861495 isoform X2 [Girardinichthys multiradiatus]|uniref:uncharacterized protein LOC124861495 isoform X2 n=1 Tax=Girardinichthys multiradiatus TaxID=208333 RepID=UPI001FAD73D2|nr:uncharacterized protein LOC124861495 isoform X2 [Girardinichthys multiradiatus]
MDLQWMLLLMVLVCSETQNVTDQTVKAELGQAVTLTCSFNFTDIYWYMEVHHKIRASIGRSYSPTSSTFSSPDFESKYLISENRLVVKDISAEDFRRYFCGRKISGSIVYGDTFRLVSDVPHCEADHHLLLSCGPQLPALSNSSSALFLLEEEKSPGG